MTESDEQNLTQTHGSSPDELVELEELFKSRFTSDDVEYTRAVKTPLAPPPCIENWYTRPKRTYDYSRDGQGRGRGGWQERGQGRYNRDSRGSYNRDNNRDRSYGNRDQNYQHRDQGRDNRNRGHNQQQYGHGNQGYGRDNQGYGRDNQGYGRDNQGYGRDNRGQRDNEQNTGRVQYAGMRRPDGGHESRQHSNSHPYQRKT